MSTKSNRSAGTQHTQKGVTQGVTLVDPKTGNPVNVIQGPDGKWRLAVDANVTAHVSGVEVSLDGVGPDGDDVSIVDNVTGNKFKIEADGSINANIESDAADGDNIGLKLQERNASPSDTQYNKRVTAVTGSQDSTHTSMDVSLHDKEGNGIDSNYGDSSDAVRTAAQLGNSTGQADFNQGATGPQTVRTSSNQGLPNNISNAWPMKITDGTDNTIVKVVKEEDQYSASDMGISVYGVDRSVNPRKYHVIKVDDQGTVHQHLLNSSHQIADFNAGATTPQTLRVTANITRNGNELSYNDGTSDANTPRTSSNVKFDGTTPDRNFGTIGTNSQRVAAIPGNAAGIADFNAGITGTQTPRVTANITRNGTELSYNAGTNDANTQRVAANDMKHDGTNKDYNAGVTGVQTPRVTANITRNGNELSYNDGTSDANTQRVTGNIKFDGTTPDRNFGTVGTNTQRVAAIPGNAAGIADFNAGTTGAQTPRVTANITRNGTELSYNSGATDANTQRVAAQVGVNGAEVTTTNRLPVTDILNLSIITAEKTSTTTASIARVGGSNLTGRKAIEIYNTSTVAIYVGPATVTVSGANRGRPVPPNSSFALDLASNIDLYIISASSATYVVTEVG